MWGFGPRDYNRLALGKTVQSGLPLVNDRQVVNVQLDFKT